METSGLQQLEKLGLLPEAIINCKEWLEVGPQWVKESILELIQTDNIEELNNRFYKNITFGTGGMRSRTISNYITAAEKGNFSSPYDTPDHSAAGSAYLNGINIIRATIALYKYCSNFIDENKSLKLKPLLVISYDNRHFSEHFCDVTAKTWKLLGGNTLQYNGPRSTPQLSFSVRKFNAIAGIMITASHNPPHDNGYKVYFRDGGQIVDPHASGIIKQFQKTSIKESVDILEKIYSETIPLEYFPSEADKLYTEEVISNVIDKTVFDNESVGIAFTPIHGTGDVISVPAMKQLKIKAHLVEEQIAHDPRFPTVKSPNPENFEVFDLAIQVANKFHDDIVIGTDPDGDRVAIGVRNNNGVFEKFSGNLTGALLAEFRIRKYKELGLIPQEGTQRVAFIKTFVTSPLQDAIATKHNIKCINTLTGFKWIGEKLNDYETILHEQLKLTNQDIDYCNTPQDIRRQLLLNHSTFFIFGGEESYGYLSSNNVRDKDANAAVVMICEMIASLKSEKKSLIDFRDEIYREYGYYDETQINLYFEGASGSQKIKNILNSYEQKTPTEVAGFAVTNIINFNKDVIYDADGKQIPKQQFLMIDLENGCKFAIRGSGTEPKIKFYLFGHTTVTEKKSLETAKIETKQVLDKIKEFLETDAKLRAE